MCVPVQQLHHVVGALCMLALALPLEQQQQQQQQRVVLSTARPCRLT